MNKTAIIYSKEEAKAMAPKDRPICYRVTSKIFHAAWDAVGAPGLKPEEMSKAALDMCFSVAEELERLGVTFEQVNE